MRKNIALGALLVSVLSVAFGVAPAANAAQAVPTVPTCLLANTGDHGHLGHTLTCAQVVDSRFGPSGVGRFTPSAGRDRHVLTVTLQYQRPGRGRVVWLPLASATKQGRGPLTVSTRTVWAPRFTRLRACATVTGFGPGGHDHPHGIGPVCTPS
ncbi:MAG TPA: hypothetical protein VHF06_29940, partial [Pseudonocardiaceae bacterium]|jgi:hypothetical protein|nr:hypothetical protein [Pseudonocardiaceae bacterium]